MQELTLQDKANAISAWLLGINHQICIFNPNWDFMKQYSQVKTDLREIKWADMDAFYIPYLFGKIDNPGTVIRTLDRCDVPMFVWEHAYPEGNYWLIWAATSATEFRAIPGCPGYSAKEQAEKYLQFCQSTLPSATVCI